MLITFYSRFPRLFAPDGGGSGGDGGSGDGGDAGGDGQGKIKPSDVLERYGRTSESALRMAERVAELENRNYQLRDSNRKLGEERDALKGKVAPDGATILIAEQAKAWEAYQQLGKPEDLGKAITDRDAAQGELATHRRSAAIQSAAEAHGYKASALGKMPSLKDKAIETREIEADGQKIKRAFVKDGDKELPLDEYLRTNDADLMGALTADGGGTNTQQRQNGSAGGRPYPTQQSNTSQQRQSQNAGAAHVSRTKYAVPGTKE